MLTDDEKRRLVATLGGALEDHIEPFFQANVRLTLLARTPGNDEADCLVTADDLGEVAKAVERAKTRPGVR